MTVGRFYMDAQTMRALRDESARRRAELARRRAEQQLVDSAWLDTAGGLEGTASDDARNSQAGERRDPQ
jgi:hypothetical protein